MKIKKEHLCILWYENDKCEKWIPDENHFRKLTKPPKGFIYQASRFPLEIKTNYLRLYNDRSKQIMTGSSGCPEDLAVALLIKGGYRLREALLIGSICCERCMNVLAWKLGLKWGYKEYSAEWKKCGTSCDFCGHLKYTKPKRSPLNRKHKDKV